MPNTTTANLQCYWFEFSRELSVLQLVKLPLCEVGHLPFQFTLVSVNLRVILTFKILQFFCFFPTVKLFKCHGIFRSENVEDLCKLKSSTAKLQLKLQP